ncbi:hypothetical protein B0H13DRAFT_1040081 [Mycena leptocephala]|nr:hypothetical protein B0H13DRAFT_1040081 [Mycena leptocephala]
MATPPVLSIPTEIIQYIMQETLAAAIASTPTGRFPRPIPQEPPLSFTLVSRQWRNISLSTRELWQAIRVDSSILLVPTHVLRLWASRAANRPRRIQLECTDSVQGEALLHAILESSQQWQDIELELPFETFSVLVAHDEPFPMLRSLSLSIRSGTRMWEGDHTITLDAPLLRRITLAHFPSISVDTAWNQLTTLDLTAYFDTVAAISALQRCPNLLELHLTLVVLERSSPAIPPFTLPSLRSLVTVGKSILQFLTVPSLVRLDLWGPGFSGEMGQATNDLRALVARSACHLTRLSLRMPQEITTAEFHAFLQVAPSVSDLQLILTFTGALEQLRTRKNLTQEVHQKW